MAGNILVVEDDPSMGQLLVEGLSRRGFHATACLDAASALTVLPTQPIDVVLTDLNMRGISGLELCTRVAQSRPDLPVIVITAFGSLETAIAAIRAGAYDFVTKPVELDALAVALSRAVQHRSLREEVKRLREAVHDARAQGTLIGESPVMHEVKRLLTRVKDAEASVLITGESGTGKEVAARVLHQSSRRAEGPFVAVNCAAMPEALLESELFGHVKGAFTDAKAARIGLFARADGGTLFLDEIGEMPIALQPKLLRALQERTVRPVGAETEVPFDARLITATNRDLETAVEERRFREDLFFRINVVEVRLPPLRERGNDVLLLAQHFLREFAERAQKQVTGLSHRAAEKLLSYAWPGNVRELQNCIERAVALTELEQIAVDDLPEKVRAYQATQWVVSDDTALLPLEEIERRYILRVLQAHQGHRTQAAKTLGLDRKTLYRKLARYGLPDDPAS